MKFENELCGGDISEIQSYTCYQPDTLIYMKDLWNMRHPDNKIKETSPKLIWRELKSRFSNVCYRESCWIKKTFLNKHVPEDLIKYTFAPKAPQSWKKNPNEWLSSLDITRIMNIYEYKYPCFQFLGPSPIDYDTKVYKNQCVWDELCNFNIETYLKDGVHKLGIIFNLDTHKQNGSHWVACFIHYKRGEILYFDSYGTKPPKQIMKFLNIVKSQSLNYMKKEMNIKWNRLRHQYGDSECGMYSLYFIIQMLLDISFKTIEQQRITDKEMEELRYKLFHIE